ncbi:hypothetical protein [Streptomyces xiaopingdaonensis]|uniref:hypothetical protein n=1 Tax=Streptomyces xiaopingdaonensis TaxID=1565415 RepID=UPI00031FDE36
MFDTAELTTAVEHLADRLRAMPQSRLERGAAAEGRALAEELALRAQRIEFPGVEPAHMPDAGVFPVGDQLAVAGADLVVALAAAHTPGDEHAPPVERERELDEALRLVEEAARRVR